MKVVIMAGGKGTRFWPRSRDGRPKQLLDLTGSGTMMANTVARALPLVDNPDDILIITGSHLEDRIAGDLPEIPPENIIGEPVGRNTAPCIGLAALLVARSDPETVMLVIPADHLIIDDRAFRRTIRKAAEAAVRFEALVTLGIQPRHPETGYGYIERDRKADGEEDIFHVARFLEKPDLDSAREFLGSGRHYWNSGMFIWQAKTILEAIRQHLPGLHQCLERIEPTLGTSNEKATIYREYREAMESVSIDYGVMEKADNVLMVPATFDWNDVGSWLAMEDLWGRDETGNASPGGDLITVDSRGNIVDHGGKLVALVGIENTIVVDTGDALLICRKDRAQDVKTVVERLRSRGLLDYC